MSVCETCWGEAFFNSRLRGTPQVEEYYRLLEANPDGHGTTHIEEEKE